MRPFKKYYQKVNPRKQFSVGNCYHSYQIIEAIVTFPSLQLSNRFSEVELDSFLPKILQPLNCSYCYETEGPRILKFSLGVKVVYIFIFKTGLLKLGSSGARL